MTYCTLFICALFIWRYCGRGRHIHHSLMPANASPLSLITDNPYINSRYSCVSSINVNFPSCFSHLTLCVSTSFVHTHCFSRSLMLICITIICSWACLHIIMCILTGILFLLAMPLVEAAAAAHCQWTSHTAVLPTSGPHTLKVPTSMWLSPERWVVLFICSSSSWLSQ